MNIFQAIKKFEAAPFVAAAPVGAKAPGYMADSVDEKFAGTGVGRKALAEMIHQTGADPAKIKERLAKNKLEMKDDETFHDAAGKRKVNPMEVLKVVLVDGYELK